MKAVYKKLQKHFDPATKPFKEEKKEEFNEWEDFDKYFAPQWGNMLERSQS